MSDSSSSMLGRVAKMLWLSICLIGCHRDMRDQPRYETLEASDFFADKMAARAPVTGTIARGKMRSDGPFFTGKEHGQFILEPPISVDRALPKRGHERFDIYCAVCHARTGEGDGMVVQRGMRRPPSLHDIRLREAPAGHFFDVITNGFGAMPSYKAQIGEQDRWAITAYVRVLQMSRRASLDDVPPVERKQLEGAP